MQAKIRGEEMTEYKQTYLAACEALFDGKPTECFINEKWLPWSLSWTPENPSVIQWRVVDPLREYKEAFEAGKRVEFTSDYHEHWHKCREGHRWLTSEGTKYRIIVEPKTVRLYQWVIKYKGAEDWYLINTLYPNQDAVRKTIKTDREFEVRQWGDTFIEANV
jgi:hypothetical protein